MVHVGDMLVPVLRQQIPCREGDVLNAAGRTRSRAPARTALQSGDPNAHVRGPKRGVTE